MWTCNYIVQRCIKENTEICFQQIRDWIKWTFVILYIKSVMVGNVRFSPRRSVPVVCPRGEHDTERRRMGRSLSPPLVFLRSHPGDFLSLSLSGHLTLWESSPQARRLLYTIIHWLMRSFRVFCWVDKSHRQFLSQNPCGDVTKPSGGGLSDPPPLILYLRHCRVFAEMWRVWKKITQ